MTIVVAGATGYLGRHIVAELHGHGQRVRAIARSQELALQPGPFGSPALEGLVDEWAIGDVANPAFTAGVTAGASRVISALGVTRQKADPWDIDYRANLALLRSAEKHDAEGFAFVNVIGCETCPAQLAKAKTAFAAALRASTVPGQIINPSGYFSDLLQVLRMAKRGRVYVLRPDVRINPIHGADLARFCVDRLLDGDAGKWDVGGPEIFTWQSIAELALEAAGRPTKVTTIPPIIGRTLVAALAPFKSSRGADTLRFVLHGMLHDNVGEPTGTRTLRDFLRSEPA